MYFVPFLDSSTLLQVTFFFREKPRLGLIDVYQVYPRGPICKQGTDIYIVHSLAFLTTLEIHHIVVDHHKCYLLSIVRETPIIDMDHGVI